MQRLFKEIHDQFGSQRKFAQETGMHETTISNILRGCTGVSEEYKELISKTLGIEWDELIKDI
jgi:transcriptional regulator with XRE-family HTH domain